MGELTAMDKHQRDGPLDLALRMHKMDVQLPKPLDGDLGRELREAVDLHLLRTPIEAIAPVGRQALHVRKRRTKGPAGVGGLVGEGGCAEFLVEGLEGGVRDGEMERGYGSHGVRRLRLRRLEGEERVRNNKRGE